MIALFEVRSGRCFRLAPGKARGLFAVLAAALLAPAVSGQLPPIPGEACAPEVTGGTTFHFEEETDDPISAGICFGTGFRCVKPEENGGPTYHLVDTDCDPVADPCRVQVRVPLRFPGNEANIDDGLHTMEVRWYFDSTPSSCSDPVQCGQVSTCGKAFTGTPTIDTDRAVFTATRSLSCNDIENTDQPLSLTAWACITSSSCKRRLDVNDLDLDGLDVAAQVGCPPPPPPPLPDTCEEPISCGNCFDGGIGGTGGAPSGGGSGDGDGDPAPGNGAFLYYAGGGVGHPDTPGAAAWATTLGRYWSHDYAQRIFLDPDDSHVWLVTQFGSFREFGNLSGGVYETLAPSDEYRMLRRTAGGWELTDLDGTVVAFDNAGLWISTTDRNGNATTGHYTAGQLTMVSFPDERHEDFTYHPDGKLATITEVGVDGTPLPSWSYTWTGDDLTRVDRPDGTAIRYTYGDARYPGYLTLIELEGTDASIRVERGYEYDAFGNAVRTWRGAPTPGDPAAVDVWQLAFDDPIDPTVTTVTDPLGNAAVYTYDRDPDSPKPRLRSISGDCPTCGLGPNSQHFYEDALNPMRVTREVDGDGTTTLHTYDANGQRLSRTEAAGTALERLTEWTYDATYPALVASIDQPSVAGGVALRTTSFGYDAFGNAESQTITGIEGGSAFSYSTDRTFNGAGQPLTIDPPGYGLDDRTKLTYDPARGDLLPLTRTDPLVGTSTFGYDPFNRRTSVTDPNLVETRTVYDELDRVTETREAAGTAAELVTTQTYNAFGDLLRTELPEGNLIEYGYDAAGRLVSIERKPDATTPGERVLYTLDAGGNRIREELQLWNAGTALWVTEGETAYVYSTRCHLDRVIQAPGSPEEAVTEYAYDCNGNLERTWDPNHPRFPADPPPPPPPPPDGDGAVLSFATHEEAPATTVYAYDPLDRLLTVTQPWGGAGGGFVVTTYGFDVQDHLISVKDAEENLTTYEYSDRDLLTEEVSPVSGTTTHGYNEHGELTSTTDARGVTVLRTVDELDRLAAVDYPDPALDTSFVYDAAPAACTESFPVGRLGEIVRNGTTVPYCYDRFGRLTRDGELTFAHDGNGNRTGIGYPGDVVASYTYDFTDRAASLTVQVGADPVQTVVSGASYLPSGPVAGLTLGNGLAETRTFDRRYAPTGIAVPGIFDRSYTTDSVGNVTAIDVVTPAASFPSVYAYQDVQYFLTGGGGAWGQRFWTYDRIGNRVLEDVSENFDSDLGPATYTYEPNAGSGNTAKLLRIDDLVGEPAGSFLEYGYDPAGNQTSIVRGTIEGPGPESLLTYDDASRLAGLARSDATTSTALGYDGRSFLGTSHQTVTGSTDFARTDPVYGSEGLLYVRGFHQETTVGGGDGDEGGGPSTQILDETSHVLYFAGRPVAELTVPQTPAGSPVLLFLTTDHLGAPVLVTDATGAEVWLGGMDPWGVPYPLTAPGGGGDGDPPGGGDGDALTAGPGVEAALGTRATGFPESGGTFLRLPGQWDDPTFTSAGVPGGLYYNVHRWYQPDTGRYTRRDPVGITELDPHPYAYVNANPLRFTDPLGLRSWPFGGGEFCRDGSCRCTPPVRVLGEDSTAFVPVPGPGQCVEADAVYSVKCVLKIPDNFRCTLKCESGGGELVCDTDIPILGALAEVLLGKKPECFDGPEQLPPGWPPNPFWGGGSSP